MCITCASAEDTMYLDQTCIGNHVSNRPDMGRRSPVGQWPPVARGAVWGRDQAESHSWHLIWQWRRGGWAYGGRVCMAWCGAGS